MSVFGPRERAGVEPLSADKLPCRPVIGVCAGLGHDVNHSAQRPAISGVIVQLILNSCTVSMIGGTAYVL